MSDYFAEAVEAYFDHYDDGMRILSQPSESDSEIDEPNGKVYLNNINGLLAIYDIQTGEVTLGD